jgi:hypothetical protein
MASLGQDSVQAEHLMQSSVMTWAMESSFLSLPLHG